VHRKTDILPSQRGFGGHGAFLQGLPQAFFTRVFLSQTFFLQQPLLMVVSDVSLQAFSLDALLQDDIFVASLLQTLFLQTLGLSFTQRFFILPHLEASSTSRKSNQQVHRVNEVSTCQRENEWQSRQKTHLEEAQKKRETRSQTT
jgi:hypothetical protein